MKESTSVSASNNKKLLQKLDKQRHGVVSRFPLWSALAATFGVVAIFYGFEKLIDRIPLLVNNPWIMLVVGLAILVVTGTTYKKL